MLRILSVRQEKSAGSAVDMNSYAIHFHKNSPHLQHFGIGIGGVRMRSKITAFLCSYFPADFLMEECIHSTIIFPQDITLVDLSIL
jgi:hypothetical protein